MPKAKQPKASDEIIEVATDEVAPQVSPEPEVTQDKPKSKTSEVKVMHKTFTIVQS
jgi:hypothetical protein